MKNKFVFIALSILVIVVVFGATEILAKTVNSTLAKNKVHQKVYEGFFDVNKPGDIIIANAHWKRINISEVQLRKMPDLSIYLKATDINLPEESWTFNTGGVSYGDIVVKEGEVYIMYKVYDEIMTSGYYKIVVTY